MPTIATNVASVNRRMTQRILRGLTAQVQVMDCQNDRARTTAASAPPAFLLVDSGHNPIYLNDEAVRILTYPDDRGSTGPIDKALLEKIRSVFPTIQGADQSCAVACVTSGRRRYFCRFFPMARRFGGSFRPAMVLLIERGSGSADLLQLAEDFHLTQREREAVQFLAQGLTSKEIGNRMGISPNTVKAFLRLAMIKTGTTTRSGIIGKLFVKRAATTDLRQPKPS